MRRFVGSIVFSALFSLPVLAQGPDTMGAAGEVGGQMGIQLTPMSPDNLKIVKDALSKARISLNKDQEKALQPVIDETVQAMSDLVAGMGGGRGMSGVRGQSGAGMERGAGEGRGTGAVPPGMGGGGRGTGGGMPPEGMRGGMRGAGGMGGGPAGAANPRLREINEQFEARMKTILKPDQAAAWDGYRKNQIRKSGGFDALKLILAEANAPMTPEQEQQVAPLYMELFRARTQLTREAAGRPDPVKLKELDANNAVQVAKFLNAAQKKALLDSLKASAQPQPK